MNKKIVSTNKNVITTIFVITSMLYGMIWARHQTGFWACCLPVEKVRFYAFRIVFGLFPNRFRTVFRTVFGPLRVVWDVFGSFLTVFGSFSEFSANKLRKKHRNFWETNSRTNRKQNLFGAWPKVF